MSWSVVQGDCVEAMRGMETRMATVTPSLFGEEREAFELGRTEKRA